MHKANILQVCKVEYNTPETVVVSLAVPDDLKADYTYKQGQHLTFIKDINGEEVRRSYSICNSVADNALTVAIRKVEHGRFSSYANDELAVGDALTVMKPAGHFYIDLDASSKRTYVAFAAGSGITPIMSIIKTTLETEPDARFFLFFGNRTGRSTIFRNEIAFLKNTYIDRFSYWHFLSQEDLDLENFKGRLDGDKVKSVCSKLIPLDAVDHAFVCGPDVMIDSITAALADAGMAEDTIHSEKFLSEGQAPVVSKRVSELGGQAKMILIIDGDEFVVTADKKTAIIDAAIEGEADVPFACKGGVCCTCRAKVLSGEVDMVLNQGLEPEEVDAGYVLTCQSFAVSDEVTLSYDD